MRLEPLLLGSPKAGAMDFNSIKVRLERYTDVLSTRLHKFQFHKGAIRTTFTALYQQHPSDFNSIKVRLELGARSANPPFARNFNSIKVRLEPILDNANYGAALFQFHKGAIRTGIRQGDTR